MRYRTTQCVLYTLREKYIINLKNNIHSNSTNVDSTDS